MVSKILVSVTALTALLAGGDDQKEVLPQCPRGRCADEEITKSERLKLEEALVTVPAPVPLVKNQPKTKNFSQLSDAEKRKTLQEIAQELEHTFPVPSAREEAKRQALSVGKSYYEFGTDRGKYRKHQGIDIYGYGLNTVAFAKGKVTKVGRYVHNFDHGNIIVVNHGEINGYKVESIYLHVGTVAVKEKDAVKKGTVLAETDCTGISDKKHRLYNPGSKKCREKAHLHFQLKVGDRYVSPQAFFTEYAPSGERSGLKLSIPANGLDDYVQPFSNGQALGSFSTATAAEDLAKKLYEIGRKLFYGSDLTQWCEARRYFQQIINSGHNSFTRRAKLSIKTLEGRLHSQEYVCK